MTRLACALALLSLATLLGMVVHTSGATATLFVFVGMPALLAGALCYGLTEGPHLRRMLIAWLGGGALGAGVLAALLLLPAGRPAAAEEPAGAYTANCASCHGADARGDTPVGKAMKVPPLEPSTLDAEFVIRAVREKAAHRSVSGRVEDPALRSITEHLRSLAPPA